MDKDELTREEKLKRCAGCRYNRYNMGVGYVERPGIDAPVTVEECWNFESAIPADKFVFYSIDDIDPTPRKNTLNCWNNAFGYGEVISTEKYLDYVIGRMSRTADGLERLAEIVKQFEDKLSDPEFWESLNE